MSVFGWMGWADWIDLLGTIDSDSWSVWGAPAWDVEGLFMLEETVRKSEPRKGEPVESQWVERGKHACVGRKRQFGDAQKLSFSLGISLEGFLWQSSEHIVQPGLERLSGRCRRRKI